jgi:hypothetical protein
MELLLIQYFGMSGTGAYPYNLGRTATHGRTLDELTSYLGDATCGSDLLNDTPTHNDVCKCGFLLIPHYSTCPGTPVGNDYELHGLY